MRVNINTEYGISLELETSFVPTSMKRCCVLIASSKKNEK